MRQKRKELEKKAEELRERLDRLAAEKKESLATAELLELSQQLDQILLEWEKLKSEEE
ncbi:MAG: Spo0E family sporulation regulatory protein-aspartic acid phosphatase [Firmicutes bacterium]|nr:Spo0E family sporulation regulatory protein-aspartic acid phosphatase [Bacillota bacterium]HQD39719.1 Spo0E family sporulation regulatory protein-aspartic acid phosphatase [Bacillota bacterium]